MVPKIFCKNIHLAPWGHGGRDLPPCPTAVGGRVVM